MRSKTLGAAFVAALMLGALLATGASAHSWRLNGSELTKPSAFEDPASLEFENTHYGDNDLCSFVENGAVGAGALGEITSITNKTGEKIVKCEVLRTGLCASAVEFEAYDLPWATEITTVNGVLRDVIKADGHGAPGWKIKCKALGSPYEFICEAATNTGIANSSKGAELSYDASSPKTGCTIGGSGIFATHGAVRLTTASGIFSVGPETGEWLVNGAHPSKAVAVQTKGTLVLRDPNSGPTWNARPQAKSPSALSVAEK